MALTQLPLTLHCGRRKYYDQNYILIWSLFSMICSWMNHLLLCKRLAAILYIYSLISIFCFKYWWISLISTKNSSHSVFLVKLWKIKQISETINLNIKIKTYLCVKGAPTRLNPRFQSSTYVNKIFKAVFQFKKLGQNIHRY